MVHGSENQDELTELKSEIRKLSYILGQLLEEKVTGNALSQDLAGTLFRDAWDIYHRMIGD